MKSLHRLRTRETTHRGQIDKLELDLQRHRDMLQGVLSRTRVESEECDELRAQVAKEQAPPEACETIPPTQSDSQPEEMYLSTVEEESGDESMLMGTSTGAEDDLDVVRDNSIWERRRNAIIKNKRMVKLKDKDKLKVKPCKTIIIEEETPPAAPDSRKLKLLPDFLRMKLGSSLVTCRPPLCKVGCNLLVRNSFWMPLLGPLLQGVSSVSSRDVFTTLKSKVARSFVSGSILNSRCIAEPPRCDPKRGQRGEQCCSFSSSNGSSLAGAGRSAGLYPSD